MPCAISRQEEEEYERAANLKHYGVADLDHRITTTVACELARVLSAAGLVQQLSPMACAWIVRHAAEDAKRQVETSLTCPKCRSVKVEETTMGWVNGKNPNLRTCRDCTYRWPAASEEGA